MFASRDTVMKFRRSNFFWTVAKVSIIWILDNNFSGSGHHVDGFINPVGPLSKAVAGLLPPVIDKKEKDKIDQSGSLVLEFPEISKVGSGTSSKAGGGSISSTVALNSFSEPPGGGYYGNVHENDDQFRYQGPRPYDYTLNNELLSANSGFSGVSTGFGGMNSGFNGAVNRLNGMNINSVGRLNENHNGYSEPTSFMDARGRGNYPAGVGFGQSPPSGIVGGEPPFDFDYNRRYNSDATIVAPPPRPGDFDYTDSMIMNVGGRGNPNLEYYDVGVAGMDSAGVVGMGPMSVDSLREQLEQTRVALRGRTREVSELRADLRALDLQIERYEDYIEDLQEQLRMETGRDVTRDSPFSSSRGGARTNESEWTRNGSMQKGRTSSDVSSRRGDYDDKRKDDRSRSSKSSNFDFRDKNRVRTDGYGRDDDYDDVGRKRPRGGNVGSNSSSRTVSENRRNTVSDFREQNKVTTDGYGRERSSTNSRENRNNNRFSTNRGSGASELRSQAQGVSNRSATNEDRFNINQNNASSRRRTGRSNQSSSTSFDEFYGTNSKSNDGRSSSMFDWSKDENDRCDISDADTKRRFGQEAPYEGAKNVNPNDTTWNSNTRGRGTVGATNESVSSRTIPYDPSKSSSQNNFGSSATSTARSSSSSAAGVSLNGNMNGMDIFGLGKSSGPGLSVEEKVELFDTGAPGSTPSTAYTNYSGSSSTWNGRSRDSSNKNRGNDAQVQMGGGDLLENSRTRSMLEEAERSGYYGSSGTSNSSGSSFRNNTSRESDGNSYNSSGRNMNASARSSSFEGPDSGRDYSYSSHYDFDDSRTDGRNNRGDKFESSGGPSSSAYAPRYQQNQNGRSTTSATGSSTSSREPFYASGSSSSKGRVGEDTNASWRSGSTNLGKSSTRGSTSSTYEDSSRNGRSSSSRSFDVDNDKYTRNTIYNMKLDDDYGNRENSNGSGGAFNTNSGSSSTGMGDIGNRGGRGSSSNTNNSFVSGPSSTSASSSSTSSPYVRNSNSNSRNQDSSQGGKNNFESWMRGNNSSNRNQGTTAPSSRSPSPTSSPYVRSSGESTPNNGFSSGNWSRGNTSNQGSMPTSTSTTTSSPNSSPYTRNSNASTASNSNSFSWMNGGSASNQQEQTQAGRNAASSTSTSQSPPPWQQQAPNQSSPWSQQQSQDASSSNTSSWPGQTGGTEEPSGPIRGTLGFQ